MNVIFQILTRIRNLLLFTEKEWRLIAAENNNRKTVYLRFVLPWLCLITIATIIGTWLATQRDVYSAGYVISWITTLWATFSTGLYFSSFVITEIMVHQVGSRDHNQSFTLMAYSLGAAYSVIFIVALFPIFYELLVLAFYAFYLYWRGIPYLIGVGGQKRMIYGLLSFIITMLAHLLMFFFFGKIFRAILI